MFMIFFFFFSSRRRHTRYWRDWSSDVCSSDLSTHDRAQIERFGQEQLAPAEREELAGDPGGSLGGTADLFELGAHRSGERRGGKECRSRWAADTLKKKKSKDMNS